MRNGLIILFSLFSMTTWSQSPPITTTKLTTTRQLVLPQDTLVITTSDSGSLAFKGDTLYKAKPRVGFTTCRWVTVGYVGSAPQLAANGLSKDGNTTLLGQDVGDVTNPSILTSDRELPMNGNNINFKNGSIAITRNLDTNVPLLVLDNQFPGAFEGLHIKSALASLRMYATDATGYAGISCFAGGSHKLSIGYDGPFDHVYMADVRNTPLSTWEVDGSSIGGFFTGTKNFWFGSASPVDNDARVHIYGNQTSGALKVSSNVADDFEQIQVTTRYGGIKIKTKHPSGFASTNLYNSLDERIGTYGSDAANNEVFMSSDHEGGKLGFRTKVGGVNPTRMIIRNNGIVNIAVTPEYADNAAAIADGLVAGDIYRTGDELKIVH